MKDWCTSLALGRLWTVLLAGVKQAGMRAREVVSVSVTMKWVCEGRGRWETIRRISVVCPPEPRRTRYALDAELLVLELLVLELLDLKRRKRAGMINVDSRIMVLVKVVGREETREVNMVLHMGKLVIGLVYDASKQSCKENWTRRRRITEGLGRNEGG
jgi:hypothetical protein